MRAIKRAFGYIPDLPDPRDYVFKSISTIIDTVQLYDKFKAPPVVDQKRVGSCTGNAAAAIVEFLILNGYVVTPQDFKLLSRLFAYYNGRIPEKSTGQDAGAMIRDVIAGIVKYGICSETTWKYTTPNVTTKPSAAAYKEALKDLGLEYRRIDNTSLSDMVGCLQDGFPFQFGITVFDSFETAANGVIPMPNIKTESRLGGHSCFTHGYDKPTNRFHCQNSWGTKWGNGGLFTIPAEYFMNTNLAADFWAITKIK